MTQGPIRAITLMYHDVVADERWDSSGFPGPGAARYKLRTDEFERHLLAIARVYPPALASAGAGINKAPTLADLLVAKPAPEAPLLLTFDDGGATATAEIAGRIERFGWRGHFFIPTNYIGGPTFLDRARIRELHRRGHLVGSHSASHPERLSAHSRAAVLDEWRTSVTILSDIIGEPVWMASVPEGYYSPLVARTAAEVGIKALFTSEPTSRCHSVDGCLILGRHAIQRGMSTARLSRLASGHLRPALHAWLAWNAKEIAKRLGGNYYLQARSYLLRRWME